MFPQVTALWLRHLPQQLERHPWRRVHVRFDPDPVRFRQLWVFHISDREQLYLMPAAGRAGWRQWGDRIRAANEIEIAGTVDDRYLAVRIEGIPELLLAARW
jgi:hypothetical protein